ncbi:MAG TPA: helix-turn-helix domain-containing protein [Myxococcales bacterium]|nr:helix-turn-helix domain-containing protein [Myxococcales bacterium]
MARPADPNAKEALVAAARAEFAKRGLVGARIEDITAACGVSKGAFYLHFSSKEALFGELVEAFLRAIAECDDRRERAMAAFAAEHGTITRRDLEEHTSRYRRLLEIEAAEDRRVLEHMWAYRDVMGVLLRGAQGTKFEGAIWEITDREVERIKQSFDRFQGEHSCRTDIPPEIFGSLIVGTYVLLGMRMSRMSEKPDLAEWARSIHTLIREGSIPPEQKHEVPPPRSLS